MNILHDTFVYLVLIPVLLGAAIIIKLGFFRKQVKGGDGLNILHVYPRFPRNTFWGFWYVLSYIGKKAVFPPLSLLTVAGMIRDLRPDWNQKLVDLNVRRKISKKDLKWADLVMVSAMIVQEEGEQGVKDILKECKKYGVPVAAGGALFTNQETETEDIDYLILGEAEITLPSFLDDWDKGEPRHRYEYDSKTPKPSLRLTPIPYWGLINFKYYATMLVQFSRGCPRKCHFCDIWKLYGLKPRLKSDAQMIREFQALYDAGWRGTIFVVDDNFIGNKVRVKRFLWFLYEWMIWHNYPFKLFTEADISLAKDMVLMQLMSWTNFIRVFLGIESPAKEAIRSCKKKQNEDVDYAEATRLIHSYGMMVMTGHIVGIDGERAYEERTGKDIFAAQSECIDKMRSMWAMIGIMTALPKTDLWEELRKAGRLLRGSDGNNADSVNFAPEMNKDRLIKGYHSLVLKTYSAKNYYRRAAAFLDDYNYTAKGQLTWRGFKDNARAFVMSWWRIGFWRRDGYYYISLFVRTLRKRQFSKLPMVVELAITRRHHYKIAKIMARSYARQSRQAA